MHNPYVRLATNAGPLVLDDVRPHLRDGRPVGQRVAELEAWMTAKLDELRRG